VAIGFFLLSRDKSILAHTRNGRNSRNARKAVRPHRQRSGPLAIACLLETLGADEPHIREKAVRILGSLGEAAAGAVPELTALLHDSNREVRLAAAKSLWNITKNADRVVPALVALLQEKRTFAGAAPETRRRFWQTVMEALQRIGPAAKGGVPALTEKARDENRLVSESARTALKEISPAL
jgi:HEAT repeat protein